MELAQEKFQKLIELLKRNESNNDLISECLEQKETELSFSFSRQNGKANKKEILQIYNRRGKMEREIRKDHPFVIGYDELLPALEETNIETINISNIRTELGSYIVFSNMEYSKFIGILKSKRTLSEVKEKMQNSPYYRELTFEKGILKKTNSLK